MFNFKKLLRNKSIYKRVGLCLLLIKEGIGKITVFLMNISPVIRWPLSFLFESLDDTCLIQTRYGTLKIGAGNRIERLRVDTFWTKEPGTINWLDRTLSPHSVLYDIGANIGLYSLYAARIFPETIKVVSFEPESLNFSRLNRNIYLNGFSKTILPLGICLGKNFDLIEFNLAAFQAGRARHGFYNVDAGTEVHRQGCISQRVDSLLEQFGFLPFPTHFKIDVDGCELDVLEGAHHILRDKRLAHLLIELSEENKEHAFRLLNQSGFQFEEQSKRNKPVENYIFSKKTL